MERRTGVRLSRHRDVKGYPGARNHHNAVNHGSTASSSINRRLSTPRFGVPAGTSIGAVFCISHIVDSCLQYLEGRPLNHSYDETPAQMVQEMARSVEIIVNLIYVITKDSNRPAQVRKYAALADEPIRCLFSIIERERYRRGRT
jgi:hypothetical protein